MLSRELIKRLALQYQTTEVNIARKYARHLFLSIFYQEPELERVLFKGGTALHIVFQSPRFLGDLDFSGFRTNIPMLETLIINVLNSKGWSGNRNL